MTKNPIMQKKVPAHVAKLMSELKDELSKIFGNILKAVYLYGSYARGDQRSGLDMDVMILLRDYKNYWEELRRSTALARELSLKYELTLSRLVIKELQREKSEMPVLRNIHEEGLPA